jgi:hypothetical protein
MCTHALTAEPDGDTLRVFREPPPPRLADMDLQPPAGPVPAEVIAYFETAVARQAERERHLTD